MRVIVTGADGFVGRQLTAWLAGAGHNVSALTRHEKIGQQVSSGTEHPGSERSAIEYKAVGDLQAISDFSPLMDGADAIVHLAARVHVMQETAENAEEAYRAANVDTTERLADAAARSGVGRFVFMSTVKVNGERTGDRAFTEEDIPAPEDAYGRSKREAEKILQAMAAPDGMTVTILRPPLIYGPGVRANFLSLLKLCDTGLPLPFGNLTRNRRSLLFSGNLCDAIEGVLTCEHSGQNPAPGVYLVSDGEDLSTADLVRRIRASLSRKARNIPVPEAALRALATAVGRRAAAERICGSLQIDNGKFRAAFDWHPRYSVDQGLAATTAWYRSHRHA